MSDNSYQIHQIIPAPIPMQAVYYDPSDEEVTRQDIICLAVVYIYPGPEKVEPQKAGDIWTMVTSTPVPDSMVRPMVGMKDGEFIDADWLDGFLGIEYGGKSEDWDDEIRELRGEVPDCECPSCLKKKMVN